jgi:hypothetical protein
MLNLLRRCVRRAPLLGLAACATCLGLLSPIAASAHGSSRDSRQAATGPLNEVTIAPPTGGEATEGSGTTTPEGSSIPPEEPSAAEPSAAETRREERRARRGARAATGCSIDLEATPAAVAPGAPLALTGTLSCPQATSAAGQTVTLFQKLSHKTGFNTAAGTTTETDGAFTFTLPGPEVSSVFYVLSDGVKSAHARVEVDALQVAIDTPAAGTQLIAASAADRTASDSKADDTVTFTGTAGTAAAGETVTLQREYRKEAWHRIGVGQVNQEGGFSIPHTFVRPGQANIRVVVHSHGRYADGVSAPVSYQISR